MPMPSVGPLAASSAATAAAPSAFRSAITTLAPTSRKSPAVALPSPDAAPVTSATLPVRVKGARAADSGIVSVIGGSLKHRSVERGNAVGGFAADLCGQLRAQAGADGGGERLGERPFEQAFPRVVARGEIGHRNMTGFGVGGEGANLGGERRREFFRFGHRGQQAALLAAILDQRGALLIEAQDDMVDQHARAHHRAFRMRTADFGRDELFEILDATAKNVLC